LKPQDDKVTLHPDLPRPVQHISVDWRIIELDGDVYVATEYGKFLNFMEYQNGVFRYIQQVNKTVCYYRDDLQEQFCTINKEVAP
jgi:hypothetical protein